MNPMLKIAYDYGCQQAIEDLEKTAGPALNRLFSNLSDTAGAGLSGALAGGVGGGLSASLNNPYGLDGDELLKSVLTGAAGGAVTGSLGTALQKRLRGANLDNSLEDYDVARELLHNRRALDKVHAAHVKSTVGTLEKELLNLQKNHPLNYDRSRRSAAIRDNIAAIKKEPASVFGANLFNSAESALSSDLSANRARAVASALLPGGLGALGGYGLNELVED